MLTVDMGPLRWTKCVKAAPKEFFLSQPHSSVQMADPIGLRLYVPRVFFVYFISKSAHCRMGGIIIVNFVRQGEMIR